MNINVYNRVMAFADRFPDKINGCSEDSAHDVIVRSLSSNGTDPTKSIPYFRKCIRNHNVSAIRHRMWMNEIHEEYNTRRLHHVFGSGLIQGGDSLQVKKLLLVIPHIKPIHRKHLYYKFCTNLSRNEIVTESGINDIRQHDIFVKRALDHIRQYWKVFDYFTNDQVRDKESLNFFTTLQIHQKYGMATRKILAYISSGLLPAIQVDRKFLVEAHHASKFNVNR